MKEESLPTPDQKQTLPDDPQLRRRAISRWENEGVAPFSDAQFQVLSQAQREPLFEAQFLHANRH